MSSKADFAVTQRGSRASPKYICFLGATTRLARKKSGNDLTLLQQSRQRGLDHAGLEALRGEAPAWEASRLQRVVFRKISV